MDEDLIEISKTTKDGVAIRLQFNKKTGNLYVNDKKVVTEIIKLSCLEKFLAYGVSIAIITQGILALLVYFSGKTS